MNKRETVALLDVDGVLIQPRGYRASINASMRYLLERMRMTVDTPVEQISSRFESIGITCEWDMIALLAAMLLDAAAARGANPPQGSDWQPVMVWAQRQNLGHLDVDFSTEITRLQASLADHIVPAEAVYRARARGAGLFSHLGEAPFLRELLCETRMLRKSLTSQLVQNYALGDRLFEQVYGCPALVETGSMLQAQDEALLDPRLAAWMMEQRAAGSLRVAILTARPSLGPLEVDGLNGGQMGYSPEAEMALDLLGLNGVAVIGYGRLQWLAEQTGGDPDGVMKPASVHALAALRAACTGEEAASLLWAAAIYAGRADGVGTGIPAALDVHIFEDSTVGIRSAQRAGEVLRAHGFDLQLHCWGVTRHEQKAVALRGAGATVFEDVNLAIEAAFGVSRKSGG